MKKNRYFSVSMILIILCFQTNTYALSKASSISDVVFLGDGWYGTRSAGNRDTPRLYTFQPETLPLSRSKRSDTMERRHKPGGFTTTVSDTNIYYLDTFAPYVTENQPGFSAPINFAQTPYVRLLGYAEADNNNKNWLFQAHPPLRNFSTEPSSTEPAQMHKGYSKSRWRGSTIMWDAGYRVNPGRSARIFPDPTFDFRSIRKAFPARHVNVNMEGMAPTSKGWERINGYRVEVDVTVGHAPPSDASGIIQKIDLSSESLAFSLVKDFHFIDGQEMGTDKMITWTTPTPFYPYHYADPAADTDVITYVRISKYKLMFKFEDGATQDLYDVSGSSLTPWGGGNSKTYTEINQMRLTNRNAITNMLMGSNIPSFDWDSQSVAAGSGGPLHFNNFNTNKHGLTAIELHVMLPHVLHLKSVSNIWGINWLGFSAPESITVVIFNRTFYRDSTHAVNLYRIRQKINIEASALAGFGTRLVQYKDTSLDVRMLSPIDNWSNVTNALSLPFPGPENSKVELPFRMPFHYQVVYNDWKGEQKYGSEVPIIYDRGGADINFFKLCLSPNLSDRWGYSSQGVPSSDYFYPATEDLSLKTDPWFRNGSYPQLP